LNTRAKIKKKLHLLPLRRHNKYMFWLKTALQATILTFVILLTGVTITPVFGYVMESASWKIQQDSINFGGGYGASDNYSEEDTLGEIATGWSYSDSYSLHAGYQQMDQETYISLSMSTSTSMSPAIPGMSGGTANGSNDTVVATNNSTGYTLEIFASSSPAMYRLPDGSFDDYTTVSSFPDYGWAIANTSSEFGFSPEGADIIQKYLDNGSTACNQSGGTDSTNTCWDNFSTSAKIMSQSNSADETGVTTTVKLRAESGNDHIQVNGTYHAYLTITAYTN
jgi:hypothetical protein